MQSVYTPMIDILREGMLGAAAIEHLEVTEHESMMSGLRRGMYTPPGSYAILKVHGQTMMSDTSMEKRSNLGVICKAQGDVLIAGLGIGLILLPILKKESVTSVTVIEKYNDVIDLVLPQIREYVAADAFKLDVICSDIFAWKPAKSNKYDCIYFDIWPDICIDNLEQMATLHRRFASRLKGGRYMNSWMREHLKAEKRRQSRWY